MPAFRGIYEREKKLTFWLTINAGNTFLIFLCNFFCFTVAAAKQKHNKETSKEYMVKKNLTAYNKGNHQHSQLDMQKFPEVMQQEQEKPQQQQQLEQQQQHNGIATTVILTPTSLGSTTIAEENERCTIGGGGSGDGGSNGKGGYGQTTNNDNVYKGPKM